MRMRPPRLGISVPVVLSLLALTTSALAGDVRGTLTAPSTTPSIVPELTPEALSRARYWDEWNGFMDPRSPHFEPARELAVVLTGAGEPSTGEQPPYRIFNGSLYPATIVARAGTGIQIRNDDGTSYELFAEGLADFAPLPTAPGNPRPLTMPAEPGNWPIRDRLYPHVVGHLHTLPDLVARAFVEPSGAYTFRGVAPGSYTLHVYHGAREAIPAQPVTVTESALTIPAVVVTPPS